MREPLARHDGILSAERAHPADVLSNSAQRSCEGFWVGVFDGKKELFPVLSVLQTLIGVRRTYADAVREHLGPLNRRVEAA